MIDLYIASFIIRVIAGFMPIAAGLFMIAYLRIDLTDPDRLRLFIFVLVGTLFVGAIFYGVGCLFDVANRNMQTAKRRVELAEQQLRVWDYMATRRAKPVGNLTGNNLR